jgi:RimJ/RimL family protein N-acetyltransferase
MSLQEAIQGFRSQFSGTGDIQLRAIGRQQLDLLSAMYDRFDPLGAALGLPPAAWEARHSWVRSALGRTVNVAAFSRAGEVVGHCFLAADGPGSAEIAVFVHQEFRLRGIGAALVKWVLDWGRMAELERVRAVTASENRAALRLLMNCGFRLVRFDFGAAELGIDLDGTPDFACTERFQNGNSGTVKLSGRGK